MQEAAAYSKKPGVFKSLNNLPSLPQEGRSKNILQTENTFQVHIKRILFQLHILLRALRLLQIIHSPFNFGWVFSNHYHSDGYSGVIPLTSSMPQWPLFIQRISPSCTCTNGCKSCCEGIKNCSLLCSCGDACVSDSDVDKYFDFIIYQYIFILCSISNVIQFFDQTPYFLICFLPDLVSTKFSFLFFIVEPSPGQVFTIYFS